MTQVWVMTLVETPSMEPRPVHTLVGVRSSLAKVEAKVARWRPNLTRYEADPGEFSERGGRFVDPNAAPWTDPPFVRVDRVVVDDPTEEP